MVDVTRLVEESRTLLGQQQAQEALELLQRNAAKFEEDVFFLQNYGEILLENSAVEEAYAALTRACELDPEAKIGVEKFFYLGQIIGGDDGISLLNVGLNKLQEQLGDETQSEDDLRLLKKKFNQGIFAQIEIWMTDLCMDPAAEQKCDELIKFSLQLDAENAEAYSVLASIRISQQLVDEAKAAVLKSWDLFQAKRHQILDQEGEDEDEVVELIQPLSTLCKFAIELEQFEIASEIASLSQELNENSVESYYLEGLSNYLALKKQQQNIQDPAVKIGEIYPELPPIDCDDAESQEVLLNIRYTLTNGLKMVPLLDDDEKDEELVQQMKAILDECGGSLKKKELASLERERNGNDDWEDEIESDQD